VNGPFLWFANRGTGVVLVGLLTLSLALGVLSTARAGSRWWPRFLTQGLHRNVALLALLLLGAHAATAVADSYVDIRWQDVVVPGRSAYEPLWLALGTLALDLLVAVTLTSLLRHRMAHGTWRVLHLATYAAWILGLVHGIGIGTDSREPWSVAVTVSCAAVVAFSVLVRLTTVRRDRVHA
jgi:sulfoxide reductase heme-binding subunit YedZ